MDTIIVILVIGIALVLMFMVLYFMVLLPNKRTKDILGELVRILEVKRINYKINQPKFKWYNFELELENDILLFKHFFLTPKQEVFIEDKYRWQVEGGTNSYLYVKRAEYIVRGKYENQTDKKVRRIALFYPGVKNVMIYTRMDTTNGLQTEFVTAKTDIYGVRLISFTDLSEQFDWLLDDTDTKIKH